MGPLTQIPVMVILVLVLVSHPQQLVLVPSLPPPGACLEVFPLVQGAHHQIVVQTTLSSLTPYPPPTALPVSSTLSLEGYRGWGGTAQLVKVMLPWKEHVLKLTCHHG